MLKINQKAPEFNLPDQSGEMHNLKMYKGKKVLLYFYPKDDTPGCTTEACSFRDNLKDLSSLGLVVLGVSKDSVASHAKFAKKYDLNFPILSDETGDVIEAYGAWGKKKFMGREYMGILRMSFLIDQNGKIEKIYEEVKPKEHVGEVKEDVK
ncbi:MAG: thioredoxin-dependent thiol peroxidase [Candidatus Paceibacterota bacterium]|jgi:peroxiredoxin Q/BCP